jgi:hypothetical protein
VPADQRARRDDQPQPCESTARHQPGQQNQPRPIRPGELALQIPRGRPALGDGQLMAKDQYLDVLGRRVVARQAHPGEQLPDDQVDQLQRHERRSSHVAQVIGTLSVFSRRRPGW